MDHFNYFPMLIYKCLWVTHAMPIFIALKSQGIWGNNKSETLKEKKHKISQPDRPYT